MKLPPLWLGDLFLPPQVHASEKWNSQVHYKLHAWSLMFSLPRTCLVLSPHILHFLQKQGQFHLLMKTFQRNPPPPTQSTANGVLHSRLEKMRLAFILGSYNEVTVLDGYLHTSCVPSLPGISHCTISKLRIMVDEFKVAEFVDEWWSSPGISRVCLNFFFF